MFTDQLSLILLFFLNLSCKKMSFTITGHVSQLKMVIRQDIVVNRKAKSDAFLPSPFKMKPLFQSL